MRIARIEAVVGNRTISQYIRYDFNVTVKTEDHKRQWGLQLPADELLAPRAFQTAIRSRSGHVYECILGESWAEYVSPYLKECWGSNKEPESSEEPLEKDPPGYEQVMVLEGQHEDGHTGQGRNGTTRREGGARRPLRGSPSRGEAQAPRRMTGGRLN
jgi:hypothetical protein